MYWHQIRTFTDPHIIYKSFIFDTISTGIDFKIPRDAYLEYNYVNTDAEVNLFVVIPLSSSTGIKLRDAALASQITV